MLKDKLEQTVTHFWYQKPTFLAYCLWPFSFIFRSVIFFRRFILKAYAKKLRVPVIVVGNLTVGGTGKTPLVIALTKRLQAAGYRPGVLLRGYGAVIQTTHQVSEKDSALSVGDEAKELFDSLDVPIVIGKKRVDSALFLKKRGCNIVISDDGLQHYALPRDIEIVVVDGLRKWGNGFCLPAGPLREPLARLKSVDFVICVNGEMSDTDSAKMVPSKIVSLKGGPDMPFDEAQKYDWCVMTGIANPEKFLLTLSQLNLNLTMRKFYPDHHKFSALDIDLPPGLYGIMTHKDAVKCLNFSEDRHYYLKSHLVLEEDFFARLIKRLTHGERQ